MKAEAARSALSLAMVFRGRLAYEGKNCDRGEEVLQRVGLQPALSCPRSAIISFPHHSKFTQIAPFEPLDYETTTSRSHHQSRAVR